MTASGRLPFIDLEDGAGITLREALFGALLAGSSGAAIVAHTFGPLPLRFTAPFAVLPSALILSGVIMLGRRHYVRFHEFSRRLMLGASWGLLATLFYDAIRPLLTWVFGLSFNPYRAMPVFGSLMTGLPETATTAIIFGWTYHFWNGIGFGMMFALLRPRGGWLAGMLWSLCLQALMMITYPSFLQARLDDPGFLLTGIVGHGLWGAVLGYGLKRWGLPGARSQA